MPRALLDKRMFLSNNPLFAELDPDDLNQLLSITSSMHVSKHKVVFNQGDAGNEMFIIVAGKVKVSVLLPEDEEVTLGELGFGDAFGEISLFDKLERTATVLTLEPCEFLVIERHAFIELLMKQPNIAIQLLAVLTKRLRATNDFIKDTLSLNITSQPG